MAEACPSTTSAEDVQVKAQCTLVGQGFFVVLPTKIRLCIVYILPVVLDVAETWSMTSSQRLDALDQWSFLGIQHVPYMVI